MGILCMALVIITIVLLCFYFYYLDIRNLDEARWRTKNGFTWFACPVCKKAWWIRKGEIVHCKHDKYQRRDKERTTREMTTKEVQNNGFDTKM